MKRGGGGPKLTKAEKRALKRRWREWKSEHGAEFPTSNPKFQVGLTRLIHVHGYGYTDIAHMVGVSREMVRQWAEKAGVPRSRWGSAMRVWDDDLNRFVVVESAKEYDRIVRDRSSVVSWGDIVTKRCRIARWVLMDMGEDLGRTPVRADLADAFGISSPHTTQRFGLTADGLDELWESAGFDARPNGQRMGRGRPEVIGSHGHPR